MQKRIAAMMFAAMMAVSVIGCGGNKANSGMEGTENVNENIAGTENAGGTEESEEPVVVASAAFDLKGADYVTLCDYSSIPVTLSDDYSVTDEHVQTYFEQLIAYYGPFYKEDPEKTTISEGDIVNVDYVGKLDGEAFEGGTAENQNIDVYGNCAAGGASSFIEGFTEGLKGASVGDVIDCDVTFPDEYKNNEELQGKAVVFTFTVNSIQREITADEVDDAFAKEQFQVETVDEMFAQIKSSLESSAAYYKQVDIYEALQNYLLENCTVEVPGDYLEARISDYRNTLIQSACDGDETQLESYISTNYGMTLEEAEQEWTEGIKQNICLEFILETIAGEMGITLDEEEYASYVSSMVSSGGYGSEEVMYQLYGYGDAAYGEKYLRALYVEQLALDAVAGTTVVTEQEAVSENAGTESTEGVE